MIVINGIGQIEKIYPNPFLAIGVFDGLHRGHQLLLNNTMRRAQAIHGTSMVMTFDPHPVHVLRPQEELPLIVSLSHRLKLIEQYGIDVCIVVKFTKGFSQLTPERFIKRYIVEKIRPKGIIIGDDFRFGQNREGTLEYFIQAGEKYDFRIFPVPALTGSHKKISSTTIRKLITSGRLDRAMHLLGRPVSILGRVVRGDSRGKTLGFPTANVIPSAQVTPPLGVYWVTVQMAQGHTFFGMANIGRSPTFRSSGQSLIEVYILDFEGNLYGREILITFLKKVRDEKKFSSKDDLIRQLHIDEQKARQWFTSLQHSLA
jgi:riboflavin kinase/FMN adenylyltransferase